MKRCLILSFLAVFLTVGCATPNKVGFTRQGYQYQPQSKSFYVKRGNDFRQDQFEKDREECMETAIKEESYSRTSGVFDYCMFKKGYEYQPQAIEGYQYQPQSKFFYVKKGTADKEPPPPPKRLRADLGRIGIVSASFQPEVRFHTPMTKGKASLHGAGAGAVLVLSSAAQGCIGSGCAGVLALVPVAAAVGSIVGAITGVPSQKIKETEDTLNDYLAAVNFQETMRERFLKAARKQTRYPFLLLEVQGPTFLDEEVTYGSLSNKGIDTILEIGLRKCELSGAKNSINPDLYFLMAAGIRLIRATDGHVLFSRNFVYELTPYKFSEWSANNAQPFREELDRGFRYLAMEIVKALTLIQTPLNH